MESSINLPLVNGFDLNSSGTSFIRPHKLHFQRETSIKLTNGLMYARQTRQRTMFGVVITKQRVKNMSFANKIYSNSCGLYLISLILFKFDVKYTNKALITLINNKPKN